MYRKIKDFQKVWNYEANETLKIFDDLTDESLNQKVSETGRSLGFLAWHIVTTVEELFGHAGIKIDSASPASETPKTVAEIVAEFERAVKALNEELPKNWKDENLTDEIPMYGETWTTSGRPTRFVTSPCPSTVHVGAQRVPCSWLHSSQVKNAPERDTARRIMSRQM